MLTFNVDWKKSSNICNGFHWFCPHKDIKLWQNSSFKMVVYYFFTHVCSVSSVWEVKLLKKDRKSLKTFNYTFLFLHQWHHNFESFSETFLEDLTLRCVGLSGTFFILVTSISSFMFQMINNVLYFPHNGNCWYAHIMVISKSGRCSPLSPLGSASAVSEMAMAQ